LDLNNIPKKEGRVDYEQDFFGKEANLTVSGQLSVFTLFALSTMITYSYYSMKCARYLFGKVLGSKFIFIYLAIIPLSAIWTQATIINIIDTMFALMIFPTLLSTILLSGKVINEMHRYFDKL